MIYSIATERA